MFRAEIVFTRTHVRTHCNLKHSRQKCLCCSCDVCVLQRIMHTRSHLLDYDFFHVTSASPPTFMNDTIFFRWYFSVCLSPFPSTYMSWADKEDWPCMHVLMSCNKGFLWDMCSMNLELWGFFFTICVSYRPWISYVPISVTISPSYYDTFVKNGMHPVSNRCPGLFGCCSVFPRLWEEFLVFVWSSGKKNTRTNCGIHIFIFYVGGCSCLAEEKLVILMLLLYY